MLRPERIAVVPESLEKEIGMAEGEVTSDSIRDLKLLQNRRGYRYSVDALLLSDFVDKPRVRHCVDLGTGVGIVGFLVARRYPEARVTGIEIQPYMAALAEQNAAINELDARVCIICGDIGDAERLMGKDRADLVISNPPFRKLSAGRPCPSKERRIARHEICMSLNVLAKAASRVLGPRGSFCMIHLSERLSETLSVFTRHGIEPKRLRFIHPKQEEESKLFLIEGVKGGRPGLGVEQPLFLQGQTGAETLEPKRRFASIYMQPDSL